MINPSISSLTEKAGNRFALAVIVAKRAKQLVNGAHKLTKCNSKNHITIATYEFHEDMITYIYSRYIMPK